MKIVVLDGHTLNPGDLDWSALRELGDVAIHDRTGSDPALIRERAAGAEIVLTNKTPVGADTINALDSLRYIGVLATGFNTVDVDAAAARRIPVTNIPAYGTDSVAQQAFAHVLAFCHRVAEHSADVRDGGWAAQTDFCYWLSPQIELAGLTIGIIGFGRIGRRVAEIANAFGMRVIAHDVYHGNPPGWDGFGFVEVDELLRDSDVVSLHCPLTPENEGLIDARRLALMKPSAFLLNVSRGPLVVDEDLAHALHKGTIAGAGLDVLGSEPPAADNPLLSAPNLTITPHIAWATRSARSRLLSTAVANIRAFLAGSPVNVVNGM